MAVTHHPPPDASAVFWYGCNLLRHGDILRLTARFLEAVGSEWNISLFHYRNHGSSSGRVLAGIQVPPTSANNFAAHMQELGYQYTEESGNPAVRLFLS